MLCATWKLEKTTAPSIPTIHARRSTRARSRRFVRDGGTPPRIASWKRVHAPDGFFCRPMRRGAPLTQSKSSQIHVL